MLPILVALSLTQLPPPPPPPLVPAEPPLEVQSAPPLVRVEEAHGAEARCEPQASAAAKQCFAGGQRRPEERSYQELQLSFMKEIELTRQLSAVSLKISELDVSGPGWATGLRALGYALVVPAFLFLAPVVSGNSVAVGAANLVSTTQTLTPTLNLVGVALTVVAGVALGVGVSGGVVGWMLKRAELQQLEAQKAGLERALEVHRATYRAR